MPLRNALKLVYKIGMIAVTVALAGLAYLAYRSSTPGTGDVLMSVVLAMLALFALLSIPKLDWQDEQGETYRGILDEMRTSLPVTIKFSGVGMPAGPGPTSTDRSLSQTPASASIEIGQPEVHRVDQDLVEEAKDMAKASASIDDICRRIDPEHDRHDPIHQEAFRRVVQAMIEQE